MSTYLSLLFFTLVIIWCSTTQANEDEEIKVLKNFGENLFRELNQFDSFPDKDSDDINVQNKLEPILFSRRRRSFPDKPSEQQVGEFSDKTNPDGIQNNPNDEIPDLSSDREELSPPETNALISEQIMNHSSDPNKMAVHQSQIVQKSEQPQNNVAGQQAGVNLPVETQSNFMGQQQKQQPLVKAESNVQEPVQSPYNINPPQAQVQNNIAQQQLVPSQNDLAQQQLAPSQNDLAQQQLAPSQNNIAQQQSAPSQKIVAQQQSAPSQNDLAQQQLPPSQNNGLQQPVQANNVKLQNGLAEHHMPANSNLGQQQQPSIQEQSNGLAHASEQISVLSSTNQKGQFQIDQNSLPLNQPNYPVVDPHQGHQIIDNGGLYADAQNQHNIGNGGLSVHQQKPAFIKGNDQSIADNHPPPTNKPNSPSEFDMINNKLHPAYVTGNKPNVKPPGYQPKVYVTSQAVRPGQISVTPSKVDSLSKTPLFMISTLKNIPKEPEHSQESGKPVSDDGWYYNQEIDDSLHQVFNNDLWQKNRKQYLMNKKSETFEPMSMALFYSWIALATLAVLAILTVFRHRHKVTGYVYDLRHWHNGGYVEEGRRLLHNAYA